MLERGKMLPHALRLKRARNQPFHSNDLISSPTRPEQLFDNSGSSKPWIFDPNFGGSSNCWTGCTPRFMPNDFQMHSRYGVGTDWPLSYDELEEYYGEAEEIMQIAGPAITPYPRSGAYPLPPHELSTVDKIMQKAHGSLYISQPTARASRATGQRAACCTSAICNLCPVNAKFTIENSLLSVYDDPRVQLAYDSQVIALDTAGDRVQGVHFLRQGKEQHVKAEKVALGANAIFNAHILLNSGDEHPLLGKGLSEQRGINAYLYLNGLNNLGGSSIITANGFMMYDGDHRRERAGCLIENANYPFIRNEAGKWRQIAKFKFIYEEIPSLENRVSTTAEISRPATHYQGPSAYTQRAIDHLPKDIEKHFACLPIEKVEIDAYPEPTEYHILGTARMGKTAEEGVVDSGLLHHKFRNLWVLGGSAFPSTAPANPTLTLSALSLRAADRYF